MNKNDRNDKEQAYAGEKSSDRDEELLCVQSSCTDINEQRPLPMIEACAALLAKSFERQGDFFP